MAAGNESLRGTAGSTVPLETQGLPYAPVDMRFRGPGQWDPSIPQEMLPKLIIHTRQGENGLELAEPPFTRMGPGRDMVKGHLGRVLGHRSVLSYTETDAHGLRTHTSIWPSAPFTGVSDGQPTPDYFYVSERSGHFGNVPTIRHTIRNESQIVEQILRVQRIRLGLQDRGADEQSGLSSEMPVRLQTEKPQPDTKQDEQPALPEAAASERTWRRKVADRLGFRRRAGEAALGSTVLLALTDKPKKVDDDRGDGPRHAKKSGRAPQEAGERTSQPNRRSRRIGAVAAVAAVAVAAGVVVVTGTIYASSSAPEAARSVAVSSNYAKSAPAAPTTAPKPTINFIAGPAVPRIDPNKRPVVTHPAAPAQAKKSAPDFRVASWTAAASIWGTNDAMGGLEKEITSWDTANPEKALYLGLTPDGKWETLRTVNGNQLIGPGAQAAFNKAMYQNKDKLIA